MSDVLPSKTESVECQVKTEFVKHTYDFCWSVEDFPKYPATFHVTSPKFYPIKELSFYATLKSTSSGDGYNYFDLKFAQESGDDVDISHLLSATDSKGNELNIVVGKPFIFSSKITHKYKSGSKIIHLVRNKEYDHSIIIYKCKMEFQVSSTNIVPKHPLPNPSENLPNLVDDLRAMYTNSNCADLCLKVEETITLFAHKGILCSRSPVFAKMLQSPMDEKEKDSISIQDIELPVVEGFLEFLYTGELCDDDFDFVYDLYYAADKYDVTSLRKTCTDVLLAKLDVENACRVLCLANRHSDVQFEDAVMDFIQFHFDDIVETDSWAEFLDGETKLAAEIMRSRIQRNKTRN